MAFKKTSQASQVPDTPDKLLLELPRRRIPDVLPLQREVMRQYAAECVESEDVAMQMPTGSGKTLAALLIAEWRRRKFGDRVVYLCATRQLVHQVHEQSIEKYGLTVQPFVGSASSYEAPARSRYLTVENVAVTTYSSLFNTNPFFKDPDVIILDDAHTAENYVAALWTVRIERQNHPTLHKAMQGVLRSVVDPTSFMRLCGTWQHPSDSLWVEKVPSPASEECRDEMVSVLDVHSEDLPDIKHPWSMIRDHLDACHIYFSTQEILIRPLLPPTWTHAPFDGAKQRLYFSATLGEGGDLERLTGRRKIQRVPVPDEWRGHGVGRRFFIFPELSLEPDAVLALRDDLMRAARRSVVLVPSERGKLAVEEQIKDKLGFKTFSARDIEESKKPFIKCKEAVAIVAGRYDGIDFPGDECRLLFIEGLPKAVNLHERFLMSRMAANILFNDRIQTRVLQAIGRCTRSLEDYSAVVATGEELPSYLVDARRRKYLHPELQAELAFGADQSKDVSPSDLTENFDIFLDNGEAWEKANDEIVAKRESLQQAEFPAMAELHAAVEHEVRYQEAMWQKDYAQAFARAGEVLGKLSAPDLRGYRALWHYLAGSAAWLAADAEPGFKVKAKQQFGKAKGGAPSVSWLVRLASYQDNAEVGETETQVPADQLERFEAALEQFGAVHDQKFARAEKSILEGLQSTESGPFEDAQRKLGDLLGFEAGKEESEGSPDPWWVSGGYCFVFEDHQGAEKTSALDVTKARQVASHPNWMRQNVEACKGSEIIPVLVTPVAAARSAALPHLGDVLLWPLCDFIAWAQVALAKVRELRTTFVEPGNLDWRRAAAEVFQESKLDAASLANNLKKFRAADSLAGVD